MRVIRRQSHGFVFEILDHRRLLAAAPVITEFMASNNGSLEDVDGNTPDWIEIYNAGDASVDLAGYRLTDKPDNLSRWVFPSVSLDPNEYLVLFASRNDRDNYLDDEGNLHTNFALSASGEYLALVSPGGTVLSEFGTAGRDYPQQRANVSYGVAQQVLLVGAQSDAAYLIPTDDVVDAVWTEIGFDEHANGFAFDNAALGYETRPD